MHTNGKAILEWEKKKNIKADIPCVSGKKKKKSLVILQQ